MTGGALAVNGGIVVFNRMNRTLEIDQENLIARVQPGVVTADCVTPGFVLPTRPFQSPAFPPWAVTWPSAPVGQRQ
jgi:hypothetical protein